MKKVKAIGLEDTDDIRIVLKDDTNIYAQAKSFLGGNRLYKDSHLTTDIKESMKTLYENRNNNTYKLISIFNYRNPFGEEPRFDRDQSAIIRYSQLSSGLRHKIKEFCNNDEETVKKLEFWYLKFEDSEDPYKELTSIVNSYMVKISREYIDSRELIKIWLDMFSVNARNEKNLLDFDYIIGSIFSHVLRNAISFNEVYSILGSNNLDFLEKNRVKRMFGEKLNRKASLQEYVYIISAYYMFMEKNPKMEMNHDEKYKEFAIDYCKEPSKNPINLFKDNKNAKLLAINYERALIIAYVLQSEVIMKIKEVFDYDDQENNN